MEHLTPITPTWSTHLTDLQDAFILRRSLHLKYRNGEHNRVDLVNVLDSALVALKLVRP